MPIDDAWDWSLLMYVGTVILRRSEAQFWRMTPLKLHTLLNTHIELNNSEEKKENDFSKPTGYVDQV